VAGAGVVDRDAQTLGAQLSGRDHAGRPAAVLSVIISANAANPPSAQRGADLLDELLLRN
jgi:hypothetical protein